MRMIGIAGVLLALGGCSTVPLAIGDNVLQRSEAGRQFVQVLGKKYGPYTVVRDLVVSPDRKRFAFVFREEGSDLESANVNGKVVGSYPHVTAVAFAEETGRWGVAGYPSGKDHGVDLIVKGVGTRTYSAYGYVLGVALSPDGRKWGFVASRMDPANPGRRERVFHIDGRPDSGGWMNALDALNALRNCLRDRSACDGEKKLRGR